MIMIPLYVSALCYVFSTCSIYRLSSQQPRCEVKRAKAHGHQSCSATEQWGMWSSLRSVLIMRHQRYAPLAAFVNCPSQRFVDFTGNGRLTHCSQELFLEDQQSCPRQGLLVFFQMLPSI